MFLTTLMERTIIMGVRLNDLFVGMSLNIYNVTCYLGIENIAKGVRLLFFWDGCSHDVTCYLRAKNYNQRYQIILFICRDVPMMFPATLEQRTIIKGVRSINKNTNSTSPPGIIYTIHTMS